MTTTSQPSKNSFSPSAVNAGPSSPMLQTVLVPASWKSSVASVARVVRIDDGGQRVVVDVDQLGRVLTLIRLLGEHDRHRLADVADGAVGEQRLRHLRREHRERRGRLGHVVEVVRR